MKILHAHKYFYLRAGAERYMLELMQEQERLGHTVAPFSMVHEKNLSSPWSDFFVSELSTVSAFQRPFDSLRRAFWSKEAYQKMKKILNTFQPDIVHVHNIYTHISPSILVACREKGIPVVMTVHDYALVSANYALWNKDRPLDIKKHSLLQTAKTHFIKNSFFATLALDIIFSWHRRTGAYDNNIQRYFVGTNFMKDVLVQNGYQEEKVRKTGLTENLDIRKRPTKKQGYVCYVGRLENYKGVQLLISAMRQFPDVMLKIAGTGSYEGYLRQMARGMKNVEFLGFVSGSALDKLYEDALVSVHPSIWYEPYGLTIIEAMSKGTAVIVSDSGGAKELIEDHVSGRIFRSGDIEDLIHQLKPFVREKGYAESLGEAALDQCKVVADSKKHLKRILQEYEEVIAEFSTE